MIERLMNLERSYGEPEYGKLSDQISRLKDSLCDQLSQEGQQCVERLIDLHMRQEQLVICDAFSSGFYTAMEMLLEFEQRKNDNR